jgi:MinD-like ATPase involved in chromosome partitioning or flagellar assembly
MKNQAEDNKLNVIIGDVDWETFEELAKIKDNYNFINLSSEFAVNFILEYEKVDVVILSRKISNTDEIVKKASKKKTSTYIIGKDIKYPLDLKEIEKILGKELKGKSEKGENVKINGFKKYLSNIFGSNKDKHEIRLPKKIKSEIKVKETTGVKKSSLSKNDDYNTYKGESLIDADFKDLEKAIESGTEDRAKKNLVENVNPAALSLQNTKAIKQKIIVFIKAKGGVGSTILSLFLAYIFRKMKTLLIDLNFSEGGGDIGFYLNIPKTPNIIAFTEGYNRNAMENSIVNLIDDLDILQAPPTYELSKKMDLQDIYSLVDIAKRKYHLIIFDLPNQINDMCLGVLDIADLVIMVSDYTPGSISRLVSINNRFIYNDLEKILVMNRTRNGNGYEFTKDQLKQFFNLKELVFLNEDASLSGKTNFAGFDFRSLKKFEGLTSKVMETLTCDY